MSDQKNNSGNSFWDKIKNTDTYRSMQNDVDQLKDNFKTAKEKQEEFDATKVVESKSLDEKKADSLKPLAFSEKTTAEHLAIKNEEAKARQRTTAVNSRKQPKEIKEEPKTNKEKALVIIDNIYNFVKGFALVFVIVIALLGVFIGGGAYGYFNSLLEPETYPGKEQLVQAISDNSETSTMYYASGELLSSVRSDLRRTEIPIEEMSNYALQAVIATEDSYFYEHNGIVPKSIIRAGIEQITNTGDSGGSTLTQQLVKQQLLTNETSFERKANEIVLAMELEEVMSKEDILENYMNTSPFGRNNRGENIAGIEEAAQGIFGVPASELTLAQASFVAGLPKNPIVYSPYTNTGQIKEDQSQGLARQQDVLFFMYREGVINREAYDAAANYDITQDFIPTAPGETTNRSYAYDAIEREALEIIQEYLMSTDGVTEEQLDNDQSLADEYDARSEEALRYGGYSITSTLNQDVHNTMQNVVTNNASFIGSARDVYWNDEETGEQQHLVDYAQNGSVLIDNASGAILGFVGGVDYELNNVNHAFYTRRSPASALKPFSVYGPAFEYGLITPASMVYDREITFDVIQNGGWGEYTPTNATGYSNRWWDVREALSVSQNIPALRIYSTMYENYDIIPFVRNAGIGSDAIPDADAANLSYALGGVTYGTTVLEMAGAYASIANDGQFVEPHLISNITDTNGETIYQVEQETSTVFSEETAFLLQDILRDTLDTGTANYAGDTLNFSADFFGKTGTSNDQRDIWMVGSSPKVTLSSWMGYSNIMEINELVTENGYYPSARNQIVWARILNALSAYDGLLGVDQTFDVPEGITRDTVVGPTGMKPNDSVSGPNGETYVAEEPTEEEYFASDNVPGETVYDFAIDATNEELTAFWESYGSAEEDGNPISDFLERLFGNDEEEESTESENNEDENESEEDESEEEG